VLGIIGEYLGRLYDQAKGRPLFIIQDIVRGDGAAAESRNVETSKRRKTEAVKAE
jgi:dolichol-phosphate mannosyltransferase